MKAKSLNFSEIAQSPKFRSLMSRKKAFLLPMSLFFLAFYFTLPILTSYTTVLNRSAFGPVTWAWMFAFAQFIMTWALCMLYSRKSNEYDRMIEDIKQELRETKPTL